VQKLFQGLDPRNVNIVGKLKPPLPVCFKLRMQFVYIMMRQCACNAGHGTLSFKDGSFYEGDFVDGEIQVSLLKRYPEMQGSFCLNA